ncbi:ABC transporter substrate-binding protein, partial [Salmonella enterica subsp. enterica serovar Eastbourne]|nr:ABC transporter substrate-binding protein [Salmonella enterica subsp. enterica serovar Eastbourne]
MTRFPAAKILLTAVAVSASFCAFSAGQNTIPEELIAAAKKEGVVYSVGMPDT